MPNDHDVDVKSLLASLLNTMQLGEKESAVMEEYILNKESLEDLSRLWNVPVKSLSKMKEAALSRMLNQIESQPDLIAKHERALENCLEKLNKAKALLDEHGLAINHNEELLREFDDIRLDQLEMSVALRNALKGMDLETIGQLRQMTKYKLKQGRNFGTTKMKEIELVLAELGIFLSEE